MSQTRARKPESSSYTLICVVCEEVFVAKRPQAKYCSGRCSERARPPRVYDPQKRAEYYRRKRQDPVWMEKRRREANERFRRVKDWLNAYKIEHGCVDCGYNEHAVALDIDHVDGKTANVTGLKSIRAVKEEIMRHKCVVRCANCHRVKSHATNWGREAA